jgi:hypothetical protein
MLNILNPLKAAEEFRSLKKEKKWILAIFIVLIPGILSVAGNALEQKKSQQLTNQLVEDLGTLTESQKEAMEGIQGLMVGIGIAIGIASIFIFWVLKGVVFHILGGILSTEKQSVSISSTIHLMAFTYLPFFFKGVIDLIQGVRYQPPPYEVFLQQVRNPDMVASFLSEHNIFWVWAFILMVIAVREQFSLSNKRAFLVVFIPYLVVFILEAALASLGSQLGGM